MADTYKKVYLQIIFAVKNQEALLYESWTDEVFRYIAGIINNREHYSLAVNGSYDHLHIFFDYNCKELIPDLVREIKKSSNQFIKEQRFTKHKFEWQSGYGLFSHGYREKVAIVEYIKNQKEHHKKSTFKEEYLNLLHSFEIKFKDPYLFDFMSKS